MRKAIEYLALAFVSCAMVFILYENYILATTMKSQLVGKTREGFHRCDMMRVLEYREQHGSWPDPYSDIEPCHRVKQK